MADKARLRLRETESILADNGKLSSPEIAKPNRCNGSLARPGGHTWTIRAPLLAPAAPLRTARWSGTRECAALRSRG